MIEKVQHRATKLASSINELSYNNRLTDLNLITLVERRQTGDMIQLYKIIHGADKLDSGNHFQIVNNKVRDHCSKYFSEKYRQQQRELFLQ